MRNTADDEGGGAFFFGAATLTGANVISNTANNRGGGLAFVITATLTGANFITNTARVAGGGASFMGAATLTEATFIGNRVTNSSGGGAFFLHTATLTGVAFISNTAAYQAGGAHFGLTTTLTATNFISNTADWAGGGYFLSAANLHETHFISNTTKHYGGGAWFLGRATLTRTSFVSNTARLGGGSYFGQGMVAQSLTNVLFADNRATSWGAALYVQNAAPLRLVHATLVSPTAPGGAAQAVFVESGTVFITNTLIASHTVGIENVNGTVSQAHTLFSNVGAPTSGTVTSAGGSLSGPAAFANHTAYTLTPASWAIDQGANTGLTGDFFGAVRPQGLGFDIGYAESPFVLQLPRLFLPMLRR